jgi:hypothetical protein
MRHVDRHIGKVHRPPGGVIFQTFGQFVAGQHFVGQFIAAKQRLVVVVGRFRSV